MSVWAAGITAAGMAVSTGVSAYSASQQAKAASGNANALRKGASNMKLKAPGKINQVPYDPTAGSRDLLANFGNLSAFANQQTAADKANRDVVMPGANQIMAQGSDVLQSWLQGQVPQDVVDFTNRTVAQRTGGSFNPVTGGGRSQQDFARSIGMLSTDIQQMGVSAAPTWEQLAQSFVTSPLDVAPFAAQMGQIRYNYDVLNSEIDATNKANAYDYQKDKLGLQSQALGMNMAANNLDAQASNAWLPVAQTAVQGATAIGASAARGNANNAIQNQAPTFSGYVGGVAAYRPAAYKQGNTWMPAGNPYKTGA